MVTHSLRSPEMALVPESIDQAESAKFETEFQQFQQKNKEQKEQWMKENPELAKKMKEDDEWDDLFEDENIRELKQIFQGQSAMNEVLRDLHRKMDEIIGRQERSLSALTAIQNSGVRAGGGTVQQGGSPPLDTIRRDEVNAVLANQKELVSAARDIKNFVSDVHSKVSSIQQSQGQGRGQGTAQQVGGGGGPDPQLQQIVTEIRDGVNRVKMDMQNGYARQPSGQTGTVKCPEVACVSSVTLIACLAVQLVLIMAYLMYRDSKEQQAKKFY